MSRRRTLGAHLAGVALLSTAAGIGAFAVTASIAVWLDERAEADDPDEPELDPAEEDAVDDVIEDVAAPLLIATPIGLVVAIAVARAAARRVTRRIDELVAAAARVAPEDPRARLPRSPRNDELDDLAAALDRTFDRIGDGIAGLRRVAADASHELRTPLAVLINTLEVARRRPRDPAAWERIADDALDELRRTADLVEALLQGARAGAFDMAAEPLDVDAAILALADLWVAEAGAAEVDLEVDASSAAAVRIDSRGLAIALGNLVRNAIRAAPPGTAVAIRTARRGDRVRIEVEDGGPGLPAIERERLGASSAGPSAAQDGRVGLGLSIARRIVEAHGGAIGAEAGAGGGARLVVELPAASS